MMEETGRNERYLWLIELFKNGDIIPMKYLKSEKVNKEVKDERKEIIRMRFKKGIEREENLPYKEIYPMNKRLQIDLSKREGVGIIGIIKSIPYTSKESQIKHRDIRENILFIVVKSKAREDT